MTALLAVRGLVVRYGAITALRGLDLDIAAREIVAVVGPNGAGKTTLLAAIAGIVRPAEGRIALDGAPVTGQIEQTVRRGIALVPEGRHVFARLTVDENLRLGTTIRADRAEVARDIARYLDAFPILAERLHRPAGYLSGGEQQQLVIVRALLSRPRLLLLDEPSLGLAPRIIEDIYRLIDTIRDAGTAVLVVEQNAARALTAADRILVLNGGIVRMQGKRAEIAGHPGFEAAYFGLPAGAAAP